VCVSTCGLSARFEQRCSRIEGSVVVSFYLAVSSDSLRYSKTTRRVRKIIFDAMRATQKKPSEYVQPYISRNFHSYRHSNQYIITIHMLENKNYHIEAFEDLRELCAPRNRRGEVLGPARSPIFTVIPATVAHTNVDGGASSDDQSTRRLDHVFTVLGWYPRKQLA